MFLPGIRKKNAKEKSETLIVFLAEKGFMEHLVKSIISSKEENIFCFNKLLKLV